MNLGMRIQEDIRKARNEQIDSYGKDEVKANIGEIKEKIKGIKLWSKSLDS